MWQMPFVRASFKGGTGANHRDRVHESVTSWIVSLMLLVPASVLFHSNDKDGIRSLAGNLGQRSGDRGVLKSGESSGVEGSVRPEEWAGE